MAKDDALFDPELRERAWRPSSAALEAQVPDRFAHVAPAAPVGDRAVALLDHLARRLAEHHPTHLEAFGPFLAELRALVETAWPSPVPDEDGPGREPAREREDEVDGEEADEALDDEAPLAPGEAARTLVTELERLEDLLEALELSARVR